MRAAPCCPATSSRRTPAELPELHAPGRAALSQHGRGRAAAYVALLERVGPSVVIAHSQGGAFAWQVAQRRPDLFRALVLVEPAGTGTEAEAAALKDIPQLLIYGDYVDADPRWSVIRRNARRFSDAVRAAGGWVDEVDLPSRGIAGNSHMLMMDRNSDQLAELIQAWLAGRGLWR